MPQKGKYEPLVITPAESEAMNRRMFDYGRAALGDLMISANSLSLLPRMAEDPAIDYLSEKYMSGYPEDDKISS